MPQHAFDTLTSAPKFATRIFPKYSPETTARRIIHGAGAQMPRRSVMRFANED
jgi:hypothetical protein